MRNRIYTTITVLLALSMTVSALSFERQWDQSKATGEAPGFNTPDFFEGFFTRGIAATPEYLFVASRSPKRSADKKAIMYFNPKTGDYLGSLDVGIISYSAFSINDVEVSDDGQILTSNMAFYHEQWAAEGTWQFKVYKWTNKDAAPTVFIDYDNPEHLRLGDLLTVKGDLTKNAVIYSGVHGANRAIRWEVVNGVLNTTPEIIVLAGITETGGALNFPKIIPTGVTKNDPFYHNATGVPIRQFSADGTAILEQIVPDKFLASNGVVGKDNSMTDFAMSGKHYIAALGIQGSGAASPAEIKAIDVTNGLNSAMDPFHSLTLGIPNNTQLNGDITSTVIDDEVWVFLLYGNSGFAGHKIVVPVPPLPEVVVPVTENGWRRASNSLLDSIGGRISKPEWLNENSRALAVGNGHIYVVNCAENGAGEIRVLDASNGSYLNKKLNVNLLNANATSGNKLRIADVEVDDAGHILACNMRMGEPLYIYAWDTEDSEPYVLAKAAGMPYAAEGDEGIWQQTSYYFDVKGDIKGNAVIIAARSNLAVTYRWVITGGVVQDGGKPIVTINQSAFGPYAAATLESANPDAPIWISGNTIHATRFLADGTFKGTIPSEVAVDPNGYNQELTRSIKYLEWDGKKYLFEYAWSWSSKQCLIDVTSEDPSNLTKEDRLLVGANLGQMPQPLIWGDVDYFIGEDGALNLITLESNNGIILTRLPSTGTSTNELKNNELIIYPNQTNDYLNIQHPEGVNKVEIISMAGVVMKSIDSIYQERVDVSMLNSGIYFVKVTTKQKSIAVSKFVVH